MKALGIGDWLIGCLVDWLFGGWGVLSFSGLLFQGLMPVAQGRVVD